MNIKYVGAALITFSFFSLFGCGGSLPSQRETILDQNWGRAYETARYQQIINPEAGKTAEPVIGLDGKVAIRSLDRYYRGETPPPVYNINIEGIGR